MLENELGDNFATTMNKFEQQLLAKINCCAIGKVDTVNFAAQTITAQIVYKRVLASGTIKDYPLLLDVPFVILQGGGSYLGMPIKKGDYCIVLFCDRNFSVWWDSGAEKEPESERKHSLSDGIAIVGLNPRSSPLGYDGNGVKWFFADDISLESTGKIHIGNSAQDILKIFNGLIDVIKGLSTYGSPTAQVLDATSQQVLESYKNTVGQLFKEAE